MERKRLDDYIKPGMNGIYVPISRVRPASDNYRHLYTKKELMGLAYSIAKQGQMQPGLAECNRGNFDLVAGSRRYYAILLAQQLGWIKDPQYFLRGTGKLPIVLKRKIQMYENEGKKRIPSQQKADALFTMYQISLANNLGEREAGRVHDAENYWEIPEELRGRLPVARYARSLGKSASSVMDSFRYFLAHASIRNMVGKGELSYGVAIQLGKAPKDEQLGLLKEITTKKVGEKYETVPATETRTRERVQRFLATEEKNWFKSQSLAPSKNVGLRNLNSALRESERILGYFATMSEDDPGMMSLSARVNGHKIRARVVLKDSYASFRELHNQLMENSVYAKRWEGVLNPRSNKLEDLILSLGDKDAKDRGNIMQQAVSINLPLSQIHPNPLNPRGEVVEDKELQALREDIQEVRMINPLVVMKVREGYYITIEGHRRLKASDGTDLEYVPTRVLPKLTRDQQLALMYAADIFGEVNLHDRAIGIARQYHEEKKADRKLTLDQFCKRHKDRWHPKLVRDAVVYSGVPEVIKTMYQEGLVSYGLVVRAAREFDGPRKELVDLTKSAVLFRKKPHDVVKEVRRDRNQGAPFSKETIEALKKDAEKRYLIEQLQLNLENSSGLSRGVGERIVGDYDACHRFQRVFKKLEELVR